MSLFEDKTYENIKEEMLEDLLARAEELPESERNIDASQGSFIDMAISKFAIRVEEMYMDMNELDENMLVDTQDIDHLIDSGAECGLPINEGTEAVVIVDLNCPCEIGDEFTAIDSDYNYIAIEYVGTVTNADESISYRYYMEADDDGIEPGQYHGEVEPVDFMDGFESGQVVGTHKAGTEQEDEETYRDRRLNSFNMRSCAGNRDYYIDTIGALTGVGGVKVKRRQTGQSYIPCYIQADDFGVPSASVISYVKETMDPTATEGEGDGLCPLGHKLDVNAVTGVTIDVEGTFTFDSGYTFSGLKEAMSAAIDEYIKAQAETWQSSTSIIIRRAMIESKILGVTGVLDVQDLTLNGDDENITTTEYQVPVLGELTEASNG